MFLSGKFSIIKKKGRLFMNILKLTAYILVIIGALNWGLIGFFNFNLVSIIFGNMSILGRIVYSLVGLSALILLFINKNIFYNND